MEDPAVTNFRDYIRINTVQPTPDYSSAVVWLRSQAKQLEAQFNVLECVPGKPIVIFTIPGKSPNLQSILLNSHIDVVPVFAELWKYEPFSAHKDDEGNIYGRGTQDMKCVGVQYIEAMRRFKKSAIQHLRTIHLLFVPDEEIGGIDGMKKFVKTEQFKDLNVGFALDEGYASQTDSFHLFYGERSIWDIYVRCHGPPGHGSQFIANTSGEKFRRVIDKFLSFRDAEEERLKKDASLSLGDVITINLTIVEGGVQFNVIPSELVAGFDIRIPPSVDLVEFEARIRRWCQESGDDVRIDFVRKPLDQSCTNIEEGKNKWWKAFQVAASKENIQLMPKIFPGGTDARYIREVGIPALGFSPMNNTPLLLHDNDEFLNENIFLRGIKIYESIIQSVANVPE